MEEVQMTIEKATGGSWIKAGKVAYDYTKERDARP
jgi:hypothetical protein